MSLSMLSPEVVWNRLLESMTLRNDVVLAWFLDF